MTGKHLIRLLLSSVLMSAFCSTVFSGVATATEATLPCDPGAPGGTASDQAIADTVNGRLTGSLANDLTAYRVSCARIIVSAVHADGLDEQAAVIAITTTIVESTIENVTYRGGSSLGLYQQTSAWGTAAQREDPVWATNAFLNVMRQDYPGNSWETAPVGEVCQRVQQSGYPGAYQPQAADGARIADALWGSSALPPASDRSSVVGGR